MPLLIAGNWKMNGAPGAGVALARAVAEGAPMGVDLLVCPPFPLLPPLAEALAGSRVRLGAQDCSPHPDGAHTGDVSATLLAAVGCRDVILGHSERRADHGEASPLVRAKAEAAMRAGLRPIVCVGESEAERAAGACERVVCGQVAQSVPEGFTGAVAYEPVWAIGTGRTPTEAEVAAMHAAIRAELVQRLGEAGLGVAILYGGSVKPANAASLLRVAEVGGALVGGASLNPADFLAIARAGVGVGAG